VEQICFFYAEEAGWENDFLLQSLYLQLFAAALISGERTMQVSEAFTGGVVGAGPSDLLAALPPDDRLAFQYTTADRREIS
jgi:hypothetical protein